MKNKIYSFCLASVLSLGLSGCNSGQEHTGSTTAAAASQSNSLKSSNGIQAMERVDIWNLFNSDLSSATTPKCDAGGNICVSVDIVSTAYASGTGGTDYFLRKAIGSNLTVQFKKNVSGFRLSDIFSNTSGLPNGHISQVVTDKCDELIKNSGVNLAGKSCQIHLLYTADQANRNQEIDFIFKWSGNDSGYTFPVVFSNLKQTDQNVAILNENSSVDNDDIIPLFASSAEDANQSGIAYLTEISQVNIANVGSAALGGVGGQPTIKVKLAQKSSSYDFDTMFLLNSYYTDCNDSTVQIGKSCKFRFHFVPNMTNNEIDSQTGVFDFSYKQGTLPTTDYIKRFYISVGDLVPKSINLQINQNAPGYSYSFDLERSTIFNVNSGTLAYMPILGPVSFSMKYQPQFNVARNANGTKVSYGFGDYAGGDPQGILNSIQFNSDADCFSGGFDPKYVDINNGQKCTVTVNNPGEIQSKIQGKPLGGLLIASYNSPVEHRVVHQIIGPLTFTGKSNGNMVESVDVSRLQMIRDNVPSNSYNTWSSIYDPKNFSAHLIYGIGSGMYGWRSPDSYIDATICANRRVLDVNAILACETPADPLIARSGLIRTGCYLTAAQYKSGSKTDLDNASFVCNDSSMGWVGYPDSFKSKAVDIFYKTYDATIRNFRVEHVPAADLGCNLPTGGSSPTEACLANINGHLVKRRHWSNAKGWINEYIDKDHPTTGNEPVLYSGDMLDQYSVPFKSANKKYALRVGQDKHQVNGHAPYHTRRFSFGTHPYDAGGDFYPIDGTLYQNKFVFLRDDYYHIDQLMVNYDNKFVSYENTLRDQNWTAPLNPAPGYIPGTSPIGVIVNDNGNLQVWSGPYLLMDKHDWVDSKPGCSNC